MIVIGAICLILGYALGIGPLATIGLLLLLIGIVLAIFGYAGHPVAGRRYWY